MNQKNYGFEFFALSLMLVGAGIVYWAAVDMENKILSSCEKTGVYLTQKAVLLCEVHSPYAKR